MLQVGIDYNVEVFVKVTYKSAGTISLAPDNLFSNCVDGAKFMHFGDTVQVAASDVNRHVIVPYVQWQEDTIRYVWTGTAPCRGVVGNSCDFDPSATYTELSENENVLQIFDLQPGESFTVTADLLYSYVHDDEYPNEAGMYFAKFYSTAPGKIQVVKVPRALPRKNATLLRHGHTYPLNANDTAVFAIPTSWNDDTLHTMFITPTSHVFRMSIATDPDFSDAHILKTYQFDKANTGHWLGIYGTEVKTFWEKTTEQYLYVRFDCSEVTTISLEKWKPSSCFNSATLINSRDTTFRAPRASTTKYKFNYEQLRGGDWSFTFTPAASYKVFIGTDCNLTSSTTASNLLTYRQTTSAQNKANIKAEKIDEWAPSIDEEGYVYVYIYHTNSGICNVRIVSTAPEEKDPVYPAMTVSVSCDESGNAYFRVSEDQHVVILEGTTEKHSFDAVVGQTYTISDLPAGTYTLRGKNDEIVLKL